MLILKLLQLLPWKYMYVKEMWFLSIFFVILKANLCVQHFCSFGLMFYVVNLLIETYSPDICVPCMLEHVCYEQFSFKKLQI